MHKQWHLTCKDHGTDTCAILTCVTSNIPSVCIVIPLYQKTLSGKEQLSLQQCLTTLGHHPIIIAKPESLDIEPLLATHPALRCETFADAYFQSIDGYNRLMLADHFYARFKQFEYLLIYQLDAFVFSDQLQHWCQRGYDYIGAPWLPRNKTAPPSTWFRLKQRLYQKLDVRDKRHGGLHHAQYAYLGGNGGLSLRRVSAMRTALAARQAQLPAYLARKHHSCNEDVFFCVEANRTQQLVKLAPFATALQFAWEANPAAAMNLNNGHLPFGCHGWDKLHQEQWQPIFADLGHDLEQLR